MSGKAGAVIGSALWDFSLTADRRPDFGDTVLCGPVLKSPGGKGLNQAIALKRLGADVQFVSAVGADPLGDELRKYIIEQGLSPDTIYSVSASPTGIGVPVNVPSLGKFGFAAPGAAFLLPNQAVDWIRENIGALNWILCHFETSKDVLSSIIRIARCSDLKIYVNAAPRNDEFKEIAAAADVLVVNSSEIKWLLPSLSDNPRQIEDAANDLRRRLGVDTVIVTQGKHGAAWATTEASGSIPAVPMKVLSPIGAGDALCAGLVHSIEIQGKALGDALLFASCCAALAVSGGGAADAMPSFSAVAQLYAQQTMIR